MTNARRTFLREVMEMAWSLYRSDPARTFADALAGAWRWTKGRAARMASNAAFLARHKGHAAFGSMLQSPIRRSLSGPYRETTARALGRVTSAVGR